MPQEHSTFYPRVFGTVTAAVLGVVMFWILKPFAGSLLWAGLLACLLFPLNVRLRAKLGRRPSLAALLLTAAAVIVVVVPTVVVGVLLTSQVSGLLDQMQAGAAQRRIGGAGDVSAIIDGLARRAAPAHQDLVNAGGALLEAQRRGCQPETPGPECLFVHQAQSGVAIRGQPALPQPAGERVVRAHVLDVQHLEAVSLGRADGLPQMDQLSAGEDVAAQEEAGRIVPDAFGPRDRLVQEEPVR
jgi:hypothetical protein